MSDGTPITWNTLLQGLRWLPLLGLAYVAVSEDINADRDRAEMQAEIKALQGILDHKAMTEFAKWQTNIQRDVMELRKVCK